MIKYWKIILSLVSMLKPGSILLPVLNYSSLCIIKLHKLLLLQPYCPVVIEINRKIHFESGSLWGNKFIYQQEFYFLKQKQYFAEECFGDNCICLSPCVY